MDEGGRAPHHRQGVVPPRPHVLHVDQVVQRHRQMLERLDERVPQHGQADLTLDAGLHHIGLVVAPEQRLLELVGPQQDDPVGRAGVALDGVEPAVVVHEVKGELSGEAGVERADDATGVFERVGAVHGLEGDARAVRPLLGRAVGAVRGDPAVHDGAVGAPHGPVDERLHQPRLIGGGVAVVRGHPAGERPGVGQQAHPSARERRAGEVAREPVDRRQERVAVGGDDGLGDRHLGPGGQALEAGLVVQPGQRREGPAEQRHPVDQVPDPGGEVEDLFERGDDDVDLVLVDDPVHVADEPVGVVPR